MFKRAHTTNIAFTHDYVSLWNV
ncbi:protein of unknown function [Shinella sp. WSC3-e]|nr:protein of unknown function [Shinella sp. WSC3-e]